jgi:hypothetical protein
MKNLIHVVVIIIGVAFTIYLVQYEPAVEETTTTSASEPESAAVDVFSEREICKGVISTVMGRPPEIMKTQNSNGDVLVSYVRGSDNTKWRAKCTASVGKAVWGNADGRWRDHSMDPQISFGLAPNGELIVSEIYGDGSERTKTFSAKEIAIRE